MSKAIQIVVTSSRGQTFRGAIDHRSNLTFNLPRPVRAAVGFHADSRTKFDAAQIGKPHFLLATTSVLG
jgi:hypothetical protein